MAEEFKLITPLGTFGTVTWGNEITIDPETGDEGAWFYSPVTTQWHFARLSGDSRGWLYNNTPKTWTFGADIVNILPTPDEVTGKSGSAGLLVLGAVGGLGYLLYRKFIQRK